MTPTEIKDAEKYPGVFQDSNLNFKLNINLMEHEPSKAVGVMCRLKSALHQKAILKQSYALFRPSPLLHVIIFWNSTFPIFLSRLKSLRNKAVKLTGWGKMREGVIIFYIEFNVLKFLKLYRLIIKPLNWSTTLFSTNHLFLFLTFLQGLAGYQTARLL